MSELQRVFEKLSDDELLVILTEKKNEYRDDAIEIVKQELKKRNLNLRDDVKQKIFHNEAKDVIPQNPESLKPLKNKKFVIIIGIVSIIIVIAILIPTVFIPVIKNKTNTEKIEKTEEYKKGRIITFGGYKWLVLDIQNDTALIITQEIIEKRAYTTEEAGLTWEKCELRSYLNSSFYNKFNSSEKAKIINTINSTDDGNDTTDKIFLLSIEEANKYFKDNTGRTAPNGSWWLRATARFCENVFVDSNGSIDSEGGFYMDSDGALSDSNLAAEGVRPALWLKLPDENTQLP